VTIWLDNHLSPALAHWMTDAFGEPCFQIRDIGLARAADRAIFEQARAEARVFITKDRDFADLIRRLGPPPSIVLLACGNTSTTFLRDHMREPLARALDLIGSGEALVEIGRIGEATRHGKRGMS
jgi:predicted nuclease of predicted toxin-antitoxin system